MGNPSLYKELFPGFLYRYTVIQQRNVKGIIIQVSQNAIARLKRRLEDEIYFVQETDYRRSSHLLTHNCSTEIFTELIVATRKRSSGWPWIHFPTTLPVAIHRTFSIISEIIYLRR